MPRTLRTIPPSLAVAALAIALPGCAPVALYRGPEPAPGAIVAFAGQAQPHIVAGSTDAAHHFLGVLETPHHADSLVVLIYGDNRAGGRMQAHPRLWRGVRKMSLRNPYKLGRGIVALPAFLVAAIVPTLDFPRDLLAFWTRVPTGGGETRVLKSLGAQPPADLVISSGDLVTWGDRGRLWERFVARHSGLRSRALFLAAPGNHELTADSTARLNWARAMGPPARQGRFWYALDVPQAEARFVFLDSNALRDTLPGATALAEEELAWADSVLAAGPRLRFVVFHHPLLSAGHYRNPWSSDHPASLPAQRRARLLELCAARNVTAIFAGHEHMYQRVYVESTHGGFWNITSAGGGAPLYVLDPKIRDLELAKPLPPGLRIAPASVYARSTYHFCRLVLPSAGPAERPLSLEVLRVKGGGRSEVMDRIDIARPPAAAAGVRASP